MERDPIEPRSRLSWSPHHLLVLLSLAGCGSCDQVDPPELDPDCRVQITEIRDRLAAIEPNRGIVLDESTTAPLPEVSDHELPLIEVAPVLTVRSEVDIVFDGHTPVDRTERLEELLVTQARNWGILHPDESRDRQPLNIAAAAEVRLAAIAGLVNGLGPEHEPRLLFKLPWGGPASAVPPHPSAATRRMIADLRSARPWETEARSRPHWAAAYQVCPAFEEVMRHLPESPEGKVPAMLRGTPEAIERCGCDGDLSRLEGLITFIAAPRGPDLVWVPMPDDPDEAMTVGDFATSLTRGSTPVD